jgi:hypothetical protein
MVGGGISVMVDFTNCEINNIIDNTPYISNIRKEFYKKNIKAKI